MTNVLIIGAGFAGLAAAKPLNALARGRNDITVHLFDAQPYTTMVPGLPDFVAGQSLLLETGSEDVVRLTLPRSG